MCDLFAIQQQMKNEVAFRMAQLKDYEPTPEDIENSRREEEWKAQRNEEARLFFIRRYPTGRVS